MVIKLHILIIVPPYKGNSQRQSQIMQLFNLRWYKKDQINYFYVYFSFGFLSEKQPEVSLVLLDVMESSVLRAENIKPIILKAGVPVVVSLAGVFYAWIMAKKRLYKTSPLSENEADSHGTKHEESSHKSLLSMTDGELEYCKSENTMLQRKVHKLLRKSKDQSRLIKDKSYALQTRVSVINKLENENKELQRVLNQLHEEKNELLKKLDTTEKAYAFKVESGDVSKEDYNRVLNELEQVKKEHATRFEERVHLRKSNTCLMRHSKQQQQKQDQENDHIELEFEGSSGAMHYDLEHDSFSEHPKVPSLSDRSSSKRRMLLKRLKRWVEGSEKIRVKPEEKNSHDGSVGRYSVSYGAKEPQVPESARRSFSSA